MKYNECRMYRGRRYGTIALRRGTAEMEMDTSVEQSSRTR